MSEPKNKYNIRNIYEQLAEKTTLTNKHIDVINDKTATIGGLNIANFAGQDLGASAPIGFVLHHYTDGICTQIDNVGSNNSILILKNANNPGRRPDKPSDFIGSGKFLDFLEHTTGGLPSKRVFRMNEDGNMYWLDKTTPVIMYNNKLENLTPAFQFETGTKHGQLLKIVNAGLTEIVFQHNLSNNYLEMLSGNGSLGLQIQSAVGDIVLKPATSKLYVNGVIYGFENGNYGRLMMASSGAPGLRPTATYVGQPHYDTQLGYNINVHQVTPAIWHNGAGIAV